MKKLSDPFFLLWRGVADSVDRVCGIVGDEQRTVRGRDHVDWPAPGAYVRAEPAFGEHLLSLLALLVGARDDDAVSLRHRAVPRAVLGDEDLIPVRLREHRPRVELHAERSDVPAELDSRRGRVRAVVP